MSAKRQSRPRKWGSLLVTAETYEFLSNLGRKGASPKSRPLAKAKSSSTRKRSHMRPDGVI